MVAKIVTASIHITRDTPGCNIKFSLTTKFHQMFYYSSGTMCKDFPKYFLIAMYVLKLVVVFIIKRIRLMGTHMFEIGQIVRLERLRLKI